MGEVESERWMNINEPLSGRLTPKMEEAIRGYFHDVLGKDDLRGANKILEKWGWDYYDVLKEVSP